MSESNKDLVRRFFDQINKQDLDGWDDVVGVDYQHHDPALPPELQRGRENYKKLIGGFISAFPDIAVMIDDMLAENDRVAVRWTWGGTHKGELAGDPPLPATGRRASVSTLSLHRIENDRIVEAWVIFDTQGLARQLSS